MNKPLQFHGQSPERLVVCEYTLTGQATPRYGIMADYGWAERILFSDAYLEAARDIARVLGDAIGCVVVDKT